LQASANTVTLGSNTNGATAYTAGTAGGRVMSLTAVTDDTVTVNVFVYIYRGSTVIPLGLVNVPLNHQEIPMQRGLTLTFWMVLI
jgi:hypothetical protein